MIAELAKQVSDKIVFALVASILSTVVLVGFNSYNKVFEAAQAEARPLSALFVKLRNQVIDVSFEAVKEVRAAYTETEKPAGGTARLKKVRDKAAEVGRLSALFGNTASETKAAGMALSKKVLSWLTVFDEKGHLNQKNVEQFDAEVTKATIDFLEKSQGEFSGVVTKEFKRFFDDYYRDLPFYADPQFLLIFATSALALAVLFLAIVMYLSAAAAPTSNEDS